MNDLALSTAWNAKNKQDGNLIIDQIKEAGFESVELYFTLTKQVVDDIQSLVKKNEITVKTLHNYCPLPEELSPKNASPDYYSLSSLDEERRKKGIYHTTETIRKARELGALAVVLHCGRVDSKDHSRKLIDILNESAKETDEFMRLRDDMFSAREASAGKHLNSLLRSIDELSKIAEQEDIILGIENRFYFMEMPSFNEVGEVLDRFTGSKICYWHDAGHAQVNDILGFAKHIDFLERYSSRLAGVHLHDVKGTQDHLAPGQGDLDFSMLKPYMNEETIKVIEAHDTASIADLMNAVECLKKSELIK